MNHFDLIWQKVGKLLTQVARVVLLGAILIAGISNIPSAPAGPIVVAFDATVTQVPPDISDLHLPFSFTVGQRFTGTYSLPASQDLLSSLRGYWLVAGMDFATVSLNIGNSAGSAAINFGRVYDGALSSPPESYIPASIDLSYEGNTNAIPSWNGYLANQRLNTDLRLTGPEGTFLTWDQLTDVNRWNRLTTHRELDLQFFDQQDNQFQFLTVTSTIGDFRAIPEPPTFVLISMLAVAVFLGNSKLLRLMMSWRYVG
jgi:hypothetical protein